MICVSWQRAAGLSGRQAGLGVPCATQDDVATPSSLGAIQGWPHLGS